jgi:hypothetical protein
MFSEFLESLALNNFSVRLAGKFRVHGGDIGVSTKLFKKCSCLGFSATGVEYTCQECGRFPGNYVWCQSGDGADEYPVFEIANSSEEVLGAIAVFDSQYASDSSIQSKIASGKLKETEPSELAALFTNWNLKALKLARLDDPSQLVFGDASSTYICLTTSIQDDHATVFALSEPLGNADLAISKDIMSTEFPESPRPRVLAVLSDRLLRTVEITDLLEVEDWQSLIFAWRTSLISSPETRAMDSTFDSTDKKVSSTTKPEGKNMAKCKSCGETSPDAAKFCGSCGAALAAHNSVQAVRRETTIDNKCRILAELWLNHREDEQFMDFISYNDLGLPLSYIIVEGVAERTDKTDPFIEETFELLLDLLEVEDQGFEDLEELLDASE